MSSKRKRVFSLETKFNAINRLDNRESIRIAADMGVGEVQWWLVKKNYEKGQYELTSETLFTWFSQLGPILQAKALEFHKKFMHGKDSFTASDGWLDWWNKHSIRQRNIAGEKLSANFEQEFRFSNNNKEACFTVRTYLLTFQLWRDRT
ncbi:hypothetical protein PR048_013432 [Dryococelus australis]|uniref:HTH CENPB-type domain-containing protein n=1 Tax=Dryococelus australis TaxID=614101 RepID=A0ABQ9HS73_9NEOP|nr:hypothetical protein PR048_013432 [Dryococelus australis]